MTDKIVVLNTCGSADEAERPGPQAGRERLAACVTVVMPVRSYYQLGMARCRTRPSGSSLSRLRGELFERLRQMLAAAHSYEFPELIALPIVEGSPDYLAWMSSELHTADIE